MSDEAACDACDGVGKHLETQAICIWCKGTGRLGGKKP